MAESSYDCIVIGSGPGGYVAAIRAAQLGMKTAVVEKDQVVGGRCLNYACIPAKAVLRCADILTEVREASEFGITVGEPTVDFDAINARRLKVIKTLTGGVVGPVQEERHRRARGRGRRSTGGGGVAVGGTEYRRARSSSRPARCKQPIPGVEFGGRVIGTEEAWALEQLPALDRRRRRGRVGRGDRLGVRAAGLARSTSSRRSTASCPTEDPDISKLVERGLKKQGMKVHTKTLVENVEAGDVVGDVHRRRRAARGRVARASPRAAGRTSRRLGLDAAGVKLDERGLIAGRRRAAHHASTNVYAIGDLVAGPALAHKASDEGIIAAEDAVGPARRTRSSTSTSRARRSARRTSARSG